MVYNNGTGNGNGMGGNIGGGLIPGIISNLGNNNNDNDLKLTEDQYDVYVNGDFVGQKSLKNPGENLSDIDDFLKHQGMDGFSSSLDGDHYKIHTNGQAGDIKNALEVYFNNR